MDTETSEMLVLTEMQRMYDSASTSNDALDDKLKTVLSTASLAIALSSGLVAVASKSPSNWAAIALVIEAILFGCLITVAIIGLAPMQYKYPMTEKWEEISERFLSSNKESRVQILISNYVEYYPSVLSIGKQKSRLVKWSLLLLLGIILSMIVASLIAYLQ